MRGLDKEFEEEEKNVVLSNLQDETEKKEEKLREKVATEESIKKFRGIYEKLTSSSMKISSATTAAVTLYQGHSQNWQMK